MNDAELEALAEQEVRAMWRKRNLSAGPRAPYLRRREDYSEGLFPPPRSANALPRGFGGAEEWPFDFGRAVADAKYRSEIEWAAHYSTVYEPGVYNSAWIWYARQWLLRVYVVLDSKRLAKKLVAEMYSLAENDCPLIEYDK